MPAPAYNRPSLIRKRLRNALRGYRLTVFIGCLLIAALATIGSVVAILADDSSASPEVCVTLDLATASTVRVSQGGGVGSGFLISESVLVTNEHVVSGATTVTLQFADGSTGTGAVIHSPSDFDVAVVHLHEPKPGLGLPWSLKPARRGQPVTFIGFPRGIRGAPVVREGLILSVDNPMFKGYYWLDFPAEPGNSGGPILNDCGHVIGIVTAGQRYAVELGFAIPATDARPHVEKLTANLPTPTPAP